MNDTIFLISLLGIPAIFIVFTLGIHYSTKRRKNSILLALLGSILIIFTFYMPYHCYSISSSIYFKSGWDLTIDQPLTFLVFLISFYILINSTIKSFREHYNRKNYGITLLSLGIIPLSFIVFLIFTLEQDDFPFGLWGAFIGNTLIIIGGIHEINIKPKIIQETAVEIQELLEQLSQTYSTNTPEEKLTFVGKAVDKIQSNPKLKTKVINAIKAGGIETLKTLIKHPLVDILMATLEGFQENEDS